MVYTIGFFFDISVYANNFSSRGVYSNVLKFGMNAKIIKNINFSLYEV